MRLIDADRLKEAIHTDFSEHYTLYHDTDQTALFDMVMDDIDEIPTAFDKEKVIEELKSAIGDIHYTEDGSFNGKCIEDFEFIQAKTALELVEKGGIE